MSRKWPLSRSEWGAAALAMCGLTLLSYAGNGVERNIAVGALARSFSLRNGQPLDAHFEPLFYSIVGMGNAYG